MEFTGGGSFSSSEGPSSSRKRKLTDGYEAQFEALKRENEKLKEQNNLLRISVSDQAVEITQWKLKQQNGDEDIKNIKFDPDNSKKLLQNRIDELELANNKFKTQFRKIDDESKLLQVRCNFLQSFKDKSDEIIKGLDAKIQDKSDTERSLQMKLDEMKQQSYHEKKLLESEIGKLEAKIKDLEEQLLSIINIKSEPDDDKKLLEGKIDELQTANGELSKKIKEVEAQLQDKSDTERSLQMKLDEMEQQSYHEKKLLESQIGKLEAKIKDLEEQLLSIINIKSEPDNDKKLLEGKIDELQTANDELSKKIKEVEAQLQAKANSHRTSISAIEEHYKYQQKLDSKKFREVTEAQNKTITELNRKILKLEAANKNALGKIMRENTAEIQKMIAKHEQEMTDSTAKFNDDLKEAQTEIDELKFNVKNLTNTISEDEKEAKKLKSEISTLKKEITVTKKNEGKLGSAAASKENDPAAAVINQQVETVRYVSLDEIRDSISLPCDQHVCKDVVVKVSKISLTGEICSLYSTLDPNEKPIEFHLDPEKSCFKFKVNSECIVNSSLLSELLPHLYSCTVTDLEIGDGHIKYEDFMKLVSSKPIKTFSCGHVMKNVGNRINFLGIYEIMKEIPNVEICQIKGIKSLEKCQKLVELPKFLNLREFTALIPNSSFNVHYFAEFIKKHPDCKFIFKYKHKTEKIPEKEKKLRKLCPSPFKIVFEY